jgi:hypothetical protein
MSRKRGVHALFLNGQFSNGVDSARPDILVDILSKLRPIKNWLQHFHCLFYTEVFFHPIVVGFPNNLHPLT